MGQKLAVLFAYQQLLKSRISHFQSISIANHDPADPLGALSPARRLLERIYRSGWVPGLYYMIEIWWNRMFFPTKAAMPTRRPIFLKDCALVSAYGLLWIGLLVWAGQATGQSIFRLTLFGFVVPFLFWCAMIGLPPMTGGHRGFVERDL
jgi:hypothetical protein